MTIWSERKSFEYNIVSYDSQLAAYVLKQKLLLESFFVIQKPGEALLWNVLLHNN